MLGIQWEAKMGREHTKLADIGSQGYNSNGRHLTERRQRSEQSASTTEVRAKMSPGEDDAPVLELWRPKLCLCLS